ncbi:hypothetical protein P389DRAFT_193931 [Cystobasidium minutum MCA 4210]|uniref:uncharacterized protein n=1 Tax=Cystobasidium minutum MCA 4210 TaxID=1397322 RepID=UPI0034CD83A8|eukprot:jgi/Rhomi1/193931/gm1.2145_g
MSEFVAETAAIQEAAQVTPLPAESRQSLDTLLERPSVNGANHESTLEHVNEGEDDEEARNEAGDEQHDGDDEPVVEEADSKGRIAQLQAELERVMEERDTFQSQYRGLLGKLSNMRTTLGDKLRQDAEELDRKDQQIGSLQAENDDLQATIETLKSELIASNEEGDRLHTQVEQLRLRADDSAKNVLDEVAGREAQLREVTEDLERCRLEREDWENQAMKERVERERLETSLHAVGREFATIKLEKHQLKEERDREAEAAQNLHVVLEEFQAAKDREIRATLGDMQVQVQSLTKSLHEYKQRAHAAETRLSTTQSDSERVLALQQEVKEKNLLIGKLRHEAVILNEHLTEALRRLKKDASENNVDRRLVTNVLLTFFNTPRADAKRFEMLQLLSSILSWSDDEREKAGLQRVGGASSSGNVMPGKPNISMGSSRRRAMSRVKGKGPEDAGGAEEGLEQSFSNLWVEYLLRESNQGGSAETASPSSLTVPLSSPPNVSSQQRNISPFAELARPSSPSKSSVSYASSSATRKPPSPQRSDSESLFSRAGDSASTAPTSVASGYS